MSRHEELRLASLGAAREARARLAELTGRIEGDAAFGQRLADAIGLLFAAEVAELTKVLDAIEGAASILQGLRDSRAAQDPSRESLTKALGLLQPVRLELSRALGRRKDEETAPFLLTTVRREKAGQRADSGERSARPDLEMEVPLEGDTTFFTGRTGELDKGGLFVGTDEPLPVGTEVLLSFVLPDGHQVRVDAVIAWVRAPRYRQGQLPAGMGVRFRSLAPSDAEAIARYLEKHPPFRYGD